LTAIVFEDVGKRQPWQAVVDKFAEDSLRDKDGTSHYRRYDLSVLDKPDTPTSIQGYWQLVKGKPLPQIVIEESGKQLFAGAEPQTVADLQTLLRQCQPVGPIQEKQRVARLSSRSLLPRETDVLRQRKTRRFSHVRAHWSFPAERTYLIVWRVSEEKPAAPASRPSCAAAAAIPQCTGSCARVCLGTRLALFHLIRKARRP
jgi:hypothetical protein